MENVDKFGDFYYRKCLLVKGMAVGYFFYRCMRHIYYFWFLRVINVFNLSFHNIKYGKNFILRGQINLYGEGKIVIGDNVTLNSNIVFNPIGGISGISFHAAEGSIISIGNNVGISNSALVSQGPGIEIEDDVMIGGSCKIYDTDFHSITYAERIQYPDPGIKMGKVVIKQGAFIGAHSIILKGVTIGRYSVVGAGSVVTKDVPDNEIWAGNPARFIRKIEKNSLEK